MNDVREAIDRYSEWVAWTQEPEQRDFKGVLFPYSGATDDAVKIARAFCDPSPITPEALVGLGFESVSTLGLPCYYHAKLPGRLIKPAQQWLWQFGGGEWPLITIGHLRHLLAALKGEGT